MFRLLRKLASKLPLRYQQEMKRLRFARQIKKNQFLTYEPEFGMLSEWIGDGDAVLDIGANVGHYTNRLSRLVGAGGRVIAFEPVTETFELLAANAARFSARNVTLLNVAASEKSTVIEMTLPIFDTGMTNFYMAEIVDGAGEFSVLSVSVDSLNITLPIKLVKIDVEGHEIFALRGMEQLLKRDHPVLIVEGTSDEVALFLEGLGYSYEMIDGSPNRIFKYMQ